jgi:hypothetical protein
VGPSTVCVNQQGVPYLIPAVYGANSYTWTGPAGARFSDGITTSLTNTFTTSAYAVTVNFKTTAGQIKVKGNNACGSGNFCSMNVGFNCRESDQVNSSDLLLTVVPNPTQDLAAVSFILDVSSSYMLTLRDVTGRKVLEIESKGVRGVNNVQLNMEGYSKGLYLLAVETESKKKVTRLMVK